MLHRVTQQSVTRSVMSAVRQATANLSSVQERLATGIRINRLSDAPLDAARAHRVRADRTRLQQHARNLEHAQHEVDLTASVLQEVATLFVEARDIAIRAADGATDPVEREILAEGIDRIIETMVVRANTDYDGRYLFAGTRNDAPPYAVERVGGDVAGVTYGGNGDQVELDVGPRSRVALGAPGTEAFGTTAAFDALIALRDLLNNTGGLTEGEQGAAISSHIAVLDDAHGQVVDAISRAGWRSRQIELTRTALEEATLADTQLISDLEDTDFAEAAVQLQQYESIMQTALLISARLMQNTLVDYLD